jgi:hypothetical protein
MARAKMGGRRGRRGRKKMIKRTKKSYKGRRSKIFRGGESLNDKKECESQMDKPFFNKKSNVKKIIPFLETLQDIKPSEKRSILLSHLNDETCEAIYETIKHVLYKQDLDPPIKSKLKELLTNHEKPLLYLSKNDKKPALKKKQLVKMGGFPLAAILAVAIPLLMDLITKK